MSSSTRTLPLIVVLLATSSARAQTSTISALPFTETGYFAPNGVSADGNVVVGMAYVLGTGNVARRWRNGIGFDYPGPSSGPVANWTSGVSGTGTVITGGTGHAVFGDLEGWVRLGNSVGHVGSPPGHDTSDCRGVSLDGNVIVGYGGFQSNPNLFQAARYTEQGGWTNLGFLAGGNDSKATAANQNGSVIVGWSADGTLAYKSAFRWTSSGMSTIPHLPGGDDAEANAVSADGSVVVGDDYVVDPNYNSFQTAWRWTAAGGTTSLGFLPGGSFSVALAVSTDGSIVIGVADQAGSNHAFIWDTAHGLRDLREMLVAQGLGAALQGWQLDSATAIGGSGPWYIVGEGIDPTGSYDGWILRLVSLGSVDPGTPMCFGDGSGSACPCGNDSGFGGQSGCLNSLGLGGALAASGSPSVANDSLVLTGFGMPNSSALYFQGSAQVAGGQGTAFGDGLRCAGGSVIRLGTKLNSAGASEYPSGADASVSTRGGTHAGDLRFYQAWYRNADPTFCTSSTFNLTNGYRVAWQP